MKVRAIASGLCVFCCGLGFAGGKTVLAERGKQADCTIVLPKESGPSLVYAAEEFQRYTERMTGVSMISASRIRAPITPRPSRLDARSRRPRPGR